MNWTRISSIVIVGFTAIGAIYGGLSMVFMPSGGLLSLSTGLLDGSPFVDYLVPGIFLFVFVGLFHLAALIYLLKKLPRTKEVMFAAAARFRSLDDCTVTDYRLCIYFTNYLFSCRSSRNVFSDTIKKTATVK